MIKAHNTFFSKTGLCTGARSKKKMVSERERNVEHFRRWKLVAKNRSLAVQSRVERSLVDWKSTKHKLVITTVLHWFYTRKKKSTRAVVSDILRLSSHQVESRDFFFFFRPCSLFSRWFRVSFLRSLFNFLALFESCFSFSFYDTISRYYPSFSFTENRGSRGECLFFLILSLSDSCWPLELAEIVFVFSGFLRSGKGRLRYKWTVS